MGNAQVVEKESEEDVSPVLPSRDSSAHSSFETLDVDTDQGEEQEDEEDTDDGDTSEEEDEEKESPLRPPDEEEDGPCQPKLLIDCLKSENSNVGKSSHYPSSQDVAIFLFCLITLYYCAVWSSLALWQWATEAARDFGMVQRENVNLDHIMTKMS